MPNCCGTGTSLPMSAEQCFRENADTKNSLNHHLPTQNNDQVQPSNRCRRFFHRLVRRCDDPHHSLSKSFRLRTDVPRRSFTSFCSGSYNLTVERSNDVTSAFLNGTSWFYVCRNSAGMQVFRSAATDR